MITQQHLEKLNTFEVDANEEDFIAIFGLRIGQHLFNKFANQCNFSFFHLYSQLTQENIQKLIDHLNQS